VILDRQRVGEGRGVVRGLLGSTQVFGLEKEELRVGYPSFPDRSMRSGTDATADTGGATSSRRFAGDRGAAAPAGNNLAA